jgi:hypothetical protein
VQGFHACCTHVDMLTSEWQRQQCQFVKPCAVWHAKWRAFEVSAHTPHMSPAVLFNQWEKDAGDPAPRSRATQTACYAN